MSRPRNSTTLSKAAFDAAVQTLSDSVLYLEAAAASDLHEPSVGFSVLCNNDDDIMDCVTAMQHPQPVDVAIQANGTFTTDASFSVEPTLAPAAPAAAPLQQTLTSEQVMLGRLASTLFGGSATAVETVLAALRDAVERHAHATPSAWVCNSTFMAAAFHWLLTSADVEVVARSHALQRMLHILLAPMDLELHTPGGADAGTEPVSKMMAAALAQQLTPMLTAAAGMQPLTGGASVVLDAEHDASMLRRVHSVLAMLMAAISASAMQATAAFTSAAQAYQSDESRAVAHVASARSHLGAAYLVPDVRDGAWQAVPTSALLRARDEARGAAMMTVQSVTTASNAVQAWNATLAAGASAGVAAAAALQKLKSVLEVQTSKRLGTSLADAHAASTRACDALLAEVHRIVGPVSQRNAELEARAAALRHRRAALIAELRAVDAELTTVAHDASMTAQHIDSLRAVFEPQLNEAHARSAGIDQLTSRCAAIASVADSTASMFTAAALAVASSLPPHRQPFNLTTATTCSGASSAERAAQADLLTRAASAVAADSALILRLQQRAAQGTAAAKSSLAAAQRYAQLQLPNLAEPQQRAYAQAVAAVSEDEASVRLLRRDAAELLEQVACTCNLMPLLAVEDSGDGSALHATVASAVHQVADAAAAAAVRLSEVWMSWCAAVPRPTPPAAAPVSREDSVHETSPTVPSAAALETAMIPATRVASSGSDSSSSSSSSSSSAPTVGGNGDARDSLMGALASPSTFNLRAGAPSVPALLATKRHPLAVVASNARAAEGTSAPRPGEGCGAGAVSEVSLPTAPASKRHSGSAAIDFGLPSPSKGMSMTMRLFR